MLYRFHGALHTSFPGLIYCIPYGPSQPGVQSIHNAYMKKNLYASGTFEFCQYGRNARSLEMETQKSVESSLANAAGCRDGVSVDSCRDEELSRVHCGER